MTHQSMVFTSWSLIEYLRLSEDDRIMLLLPLAFDYGLYQLLMAITVGGSSDCGTIIHIPGICL